MERESGHKVLIEFQEREGEGDGGGTFDVEIRMYDDSDPHGKYQKWVGGERVETLSEDYIKVEYPSFWKWWSR